MKIQLLDHFTYKKLFRFVLPSIIMMVFTSINLIMPFTMILGSVGFMVGTGGTALVSMTMGMGNNKKANHYFSMLVKFTIISGIIVSVLGVIFTKEVAILFGADESMISDCVLYGRIVISFTTAYMFQNVFQSFFVTAEKPKLGLIVTDISGITNMVLDALFIAGFKMGVEGAGIATGISQVVGGVLMYVQFIFIAIYIGNSVGCALIIGYNYGVYNFEALKNMRKKSIKIMLGLGVILMTLAEVCASIISTIYLVVEKKKYNY